MWRRARPWRGRAARGIACVARRVRFGWWVRASRHGTAAPCRAAAEGREGVAGVAAGGDGASSGWEVSRGAACSGVDRRVAPWPVVVVLSLGGGELRVCDGETNHRTGDILGLHSEVVGQKPSSRNQIPIWAARF